MRFRFFITFFIAVIIALEPALQAEVLFANQEKIDELKSKIDDRSKAVEFIEKEIQEVKVQIDQVSQQAKTLQGTIKELDLTQNKLGKDISLTQNKISLTNLTINQLDKDIEDAARRLKEGHAAIAKSLQTLNENDNTDMIQILLQYNNVSDFWKQTDTLEQFRNGVYNRAQELKEIRKQLEESKDAKENEKQRLEGFKSQLADQRKVVEINKQEKNSVLKETKNKESAYQKALREKIALRDAFEKEILEYESQIKTVIDPNSLPKAGTGVLSWPLEKVKITQYFGRTDFAVKNPQVYSGKGHNGIDLGTPTGTPVLSAADGVIVDTGDTDIACPRASYGRWILIKHNNGLSTLYGHLSVISTRAGQTVKRGQIIGYSGNTGYSTGPHVHFTVYASQAVQFAKRGGSKYCRGTYNIPVSSLNGYLNPMVYLQ